MGGGGHLYDQSDLGRAVGGAGGGELRAGQPCVRLDELAARVRERGVDSDEAFESFLEWHAQRGIELWPHQEDACLALALGDHVILGTPTGSGKSTVALWLAFLALCTRQRMYYTAPIKALVSL